MSTKSSSVSPSETRSYGGLGIVRPVNECLVRRFKGKAIKRSVTYYVIVITRTPSLAALTRMSHSVEGLEALGHTTRHHGTSTTKQLGPCLAYLSGIHLLLSRKSLSSLPDHFHADFALPDTFFPHPPITCRLCGANFSDV